MKVAVPQSAEHIPLCAFQELSRIENPEPLDVVATLCELPKSTVRNFKARSVDEIASALSSGFEKKFGLTRTFKMDGVTYGFIPNLDDATYGEVNDIQNYLSKVETWHVAMGVLYRPIIGRIVKGKYVIEQYVPGRYSEAMRRCPLSVAMGAQ